MSAQNWIDQEPPAASNRPTAIWTVGMTERGVFLTLEEPLVGGHVYQLTAKDAAALARKLLKAANKAKAKGTGR